MRRGCYWILILAWGIGACAPIESITPKTLQATGGSRADGVVELSYEYDRTEQHHVDWDQAATTARQRCQVWGYAEAVPFGGTKSQCLSQDGDGVCWRFSITVPYQCTGALGAGR
jgi:hypothetical protein